jgi:hypothetical protein
VYQRGPSQLPNRPIAVEHRPLVVPSGPR